MASICLTVKAIAFAEVWRATLLIQSS